MVEKEESGPVVGISLSRIMSSPGATISQVSLSNPFYFATDHSFFDHSPPTSIAISSRFGTIHQVNILKLEDYRATRLDVAQEME